MVKTQEELNVLKKEVESLNKKLSTLSDEELAQVCGGGIISLTDDRPTFEQIANGPSGHLIK